MSEANNWVVFWTALASLAAFATMIATAMSVRMSFVMWRSQIEPKIIVYVTHDRERPSLLLIVIKNIGNDVATEVFFTPSRPIPMGAYGIDKPNRKPMILSSGPLVHGIRSIGPGDERILNWGQYGGLADALNNGTIELSFEYWHGMKKLHGVGILEIESFKETDASAPPILEISRHLDKLAKSAGAIQTSIQRKDWRGESDRRRLANVGKFRGYANRR